MANALKVRELYCPSHFGNTYEGALDNEMRSILSEAKFWGFNRFSDWFDTIDLYNVYKKKHNLFNMPEAMWARKFANYEIAAQAELDLSLVITPNHVFSDQVTPATEAEKQGDHIFGQLVCPSKPGVTEMILENYKFLFEDFARRNLQLKSIDACPYDYGGCCCEKCTPWIVAFGKLVKAIAELGKKYFGSMDAELIGWWWSDQDHSDFTAWADREAPGVFKSMAFHQPYGKTDYTVRPVPQGCQERAFVHISYGHFVQPYDDSYGHYGPVMAPDRLEKTCQYLFKRTALGFMAYSEGAYEDINKALVAGLTSGQYTTADEVLSAYADRYLGGDTKTWVEYIRLMSDAGKIDVKKARALFDRLKSAAHPGWRFDQLRERLNLFEADATVRSRIEWDAERLAAAKAFWDTKERLFRDVWKLGIQRHIFRFDNSAPDWHSEYLKAKGLAQQAVPTRLADA